MTGEARALALAGLEADAGERDVVVRLGDGDGDVVWREGVGGDGPARVIAQGGNGIWRRAPWPARDDLFELAQAEEPKILVVGPDAELSAVVERLDRFADSVQARETLVRADLEEASVVVLAQEEGAPLPAVAPAVLAAGRVLVVRQPSVSFGLLPGIDHLSARTVAGVAELTGAAFLHWESFATVRAFGRIAAEAHRASVVYPRIAFDLLAER